MKKQSSFLMILSMFVFLAGLFSGCNDVKEEVYGRPEWLEPPIYQQLQERGNFTSYLTCVDKSGYKNQLNGSGYYTVFAPTDEAFSTFMSENGISSINAIDSLLAKKIVAYSMCVTPASYDEIDDYQDGTTTATEASRKDKAFKRTTYYYKWVYPEKGADDSVRYIWDASVSPSEIGASVSYSFDDLNQKNIPFFTSAFMAQCGISSVDYNYLYPNAELTDFNVADAKVTERDIWAENGIFHVVDKVILPLSNLEEILAETDNCSEFKNLLDKYVVEYTYMTEAIQLRYEQASGERQDVYLKSYPAASCNLNSENYKSYLSTSNKVEAQIDGYTLFAPTNDAMQDFYANKFFKYGYTSLDELPDYVISEFVNAHMFTTMVWPTKFDVTTNPYGEYARFDANSDVVKSELGSNGIFYAVDKVQNTDAFSTVLGDVLLNPEYSLMYQALLDVEPLADILKATNAQYLLFLLTNEQFEEAGLTYNSNSSSWEFTTAADRPDLGTSATTALSRLLRLHIVMLGETNTSYDFSAGKSGVIKAYSNEYMKYSVSNAGAITIYSGGNSAVSSRSKITGLVESGASNGQSYTLSAPMLFSNGNIGDILTVSTTNKAYKTTSLHNYLKKIATVTYTTDDGLITTLSGCVYSTSTNTIKDIANTSFITMFIPNDAAIDNAVSDGVLKSIANFANGTLGAEVLSADNQSMEEFVKYHIVNGNIIVGDQLSTDLATYRKLDDGTYAKIRVTGVVGDEVSASTLSATDNQGRVANVVTTNVAAYNILGNRAIVHVVDNYLFYKSEE